MMKNELKRHFLFVIVSSIIIITAFNYRNTRILCTTTEAETNNIAQEQELVSDKYNYIYYYCGSKLKSGRLITYKFSNNNNNIEFTVEDDKNGKNDVYTSITNTILIYKNNDSSSNTQINYVAILIIFASILIGIFAPLSKKVRENDNYDIISKAGMYIFWCFLDVKCILDVLQYILKALTYDIVTMPFWIGTPVALITGCIIIVTCFGGSRIKIDEMHEKILKNIGSKKNDT